MTPPAQIYILVRIYRKMSDWTYLYICVFPSLLQRTDNGDGTMRLHNDKAT